MFDDLCLADQNQSTGSHITHLDMGLQFKKEDADSPCTCRHRDKDEPKVHNCLANEEEVQGKGCRVIDDELDG
jgi:hypothetical protein